MPTCYRAFPDTSVGEKPDRQSQWHCLWTATHLIGIVLDKKGRDEDLTAEHERLSMALTARKLGE